MRRSFIIFLLFCISHTVLAADARFIEVRADRTVIYPQKMELQEGETLMDVLQMYPELLVAGYDDLLPNYQLRMDNVKMSGDVRLLLTQIMAKDVRSVQIVDNPGVAKGTTGMNGVIDITMMKMETAAHGIAEAQVETNGNVSPTVNLRHGSKSTDLWANANYGYDRQSSPDRHSQYLDLHGVTALGERDRLLTYFKQDYSNASATSVWDSRQNYLARARYFHTFNDKGTELLTLLSYQYTDTPQSSAGRRVGAQVQTPMYLLELNTPLFTRKTTMMLGVEGDFNVYSYGVANTHGFDEESRYDVFNQDFYLQVNYDFGKVKLTVGDRMQLYHYGMNGYSGDWSHNTLRNMFHGSVIYTPASHHRMQLGYYRKFVNPSYLSVFPEAWPSADGSQWTMGSPDTEETLVDQLKFAYGYTARTLAFSVQGNYYSVGDKDVETVDASLYYKHKAFRLTAGAGAHLEHDNTYWHLRIAPSAVLPLGFRASSDIVYASGKSPHKTMTGTSTYASLALSRQFGRSWNATLQWHDVFSRKQSSLMASVRYNY